MESITIYCVKNGFVVAKNEPTISVFASDAIVFEKVGNEYGSDLAGYLRDWKVRLDAEIDRMTAMEKVLTKIVPADEA